MILTIISGKGLTTEWTALILSLFFFSSLQTGVACDSSLGRLIQPPGFSLVFGVIEKLAASKSHFLCPLSLSLFMHFLIVIHE